MTPSSPPQRWWVVVNRHARKPARDAKLIAQLREVLGDRGEVTAPADLDALRDDALRARQQGVDAVAVVGGDGTAYRVATAVLLHAWSDAPPGALPALALLGGGTMNTIAKGLGLRPGAPPRVLRDLLAGRFRVVERAPLIVDEAHAGWLFGIGITPRFIEAYEGGGTPSPTRAALTLGRAVVSVATGGPFADRFFERIPATLTAEGQPSQEGGWLILMAGAAPSVGLDFRPFPADLPPDHFGVFGTRSTPPQLACDLITIRRHRLVTRDSAWVTHTRELLIEAESPLLLQLDGDLWPGGTRCVVRSGPVLRMLGRR